MASMRTQRWISALALLAIGCNSAGLSGRDAAAGSSGTIGTGGAAPAAGGGDTGGSGGSDAAGTGGATASDDRGGEDASAIDASIECAAISSGGTISWLENGEPHCAVVGGVTSTALKIGDSPISYSFEVVASEATPTPDGTILDLGVGFSTTREGPGTYTCNTLVGLSAYLEYHHHPWCSFGEDSCTITISSPGAPDSNATGTFSGVLSSCNLYVPTIISNGVFNAPVQFLGP